MSICACADRRNLVRNAFQLRRPRAHTVFLAFFLSRPEDKPQPEAGYLLPGADADHDVAIVNELLPMARTRSGYWQIEVPLLPGWYQYAFLVDGTWVTDPRAPEICPDGTGGHNSARTVIRSAPTIRFPLSPRLRHRGRAAGLRRAV